MIHVTAHAARRYVERVDPKLTLAEATARIHASDAALEIAADFGAHVVRLGCGAKLILEGFTVVTVYPRKWILQPRERQAA
jgi:hypothetical protein